MEIRTSTPQNSLTSHKSKGRVALKLIQHGDKAVTYESHTDSLSHCTGEELLPEGLKLELEPTIRNYEQEFVTTCF